MSKAEFQDDYIEHLLGTLDEAASRRLAAHVKDCPECRIELRELAEVLHTLPLALEPIPTSSQLRTLLLARIAAAAQTRPAVTAEVRLRRWRLTALAAGVLLVILGGLVYRAHQSQRQQLLHIASLRSEIEQLRNANQSLVLKVNRLSRPSVRFLNLAGLTHFEESSASAFIRPEDGKISLFFHNLPPLPPDQDFQLWVIEEGRPPHPSATFREAAPVTEVEADLPVDADKVQLLAVTIEPLGGSPQPTGTMVLAGP